MSGHPNIIGVRVGADSRNTAPDDETSIEWHISNATGTDYVTACGMDGDDPSVGQHGVIKPPTGTKVTCAMCYGIWAGFKAMTLREINFSPEAKK